MPRTGNRTGVPKPGVPKILGLTTMALLATVIVTGCSGADLIERTEQANRLQAASAFGALTADIESTEATDYPGSADLAAVKRWETTSAGQLAATSQRFVTWASLTETLTFVPSPPPGPSEAGITSFNQTYAQWSTTRRAYVRAVRRCLRGDKNKVVRKCLDNVQTSSAADRLKADAAMSSEIAQMRLSLSTTERSPTETSPSQPASPSTATGSSSAN
ncbi:MAG: hypothetical protein ACOYD1_05535 [Candidatus Nanopelagicales bacterium]